VLTTLTIELLAAEHATLMMSEPDSPTRYVARGTVGSEPDRAASVDIDTEPTGVAVAVRSAETLFVPDAGASPVVSRRYAGPLGVRSALYVPLPAAGTVPAVLVAGWTRPVQHLDTGARQVIEVVSTEAGPLLRRLQDQERLTVEAITDGLTGLSNRRTFNRALDVTRPGDAVVMIDLDHFKRVNDDYGHPIGDEVLRTLASCLNRAARDGDCVARYGGEEFAVVLQAAGETGASAFVARLREHWDETEPLTSFSPGIAGRWADEGPLLTLARADAALYEAKAAGRDRDRVAPEDVPA
jgi:diguanylate cyclase (GGDEF)-like protein